MRFTELLNTSVFRAISSIAVLSSMALISALPVYAQAEATAKPKEHQAFIPSEPTITTASYGDWILRCVRLPADSDAETGKSPRSAGSTSCEVVQTVQVQGQPQPVAQIAIGYLPNDKEMSLTIVLPANIALPGMVSLFGNGKSGVEEAAGIDLAWTRCSGGACFATAKPDYKILAAFRDGTQGQIRFADAGNQTIAIPVSWKGLDQAINALQR